MARHTRRLVGAAVLRRIRGLLEERDREEHLLRTRVVPIAAALALAAAAAIWFANAAGLFG